MAKRCGLRPSDPLTGQFRVPRSKSLAQRALIAAALCREETLISAACASANAGGTDVRSACALIERAGASVAAVGDRAWSVRGVAPGPLRGWRSEDALDAGESGTLARFATAAAGLCGDPRRRLLVAAEGTLLARESPALFACLALAGVRAEFAGRAGGWPVWLSPAPLPRELTLQEPTSSQEVSALLIAAAAWTNDVELHVHGEIPSRPYVEMTRRTLASFGVDVESSTGAGFETFHLRGPLTSPGLVAIEPDASSAAVLLGAACLTGGEVAIAGLAAQSLQGDVRIAEHLAAFGCRTGFDERGLFAGGEVQRGAELDLRGEPDLAPVLAAVAAAAALRCGARSRLTGLGTLQGKESPRTEVLAGGLAALGWTARATDDALEIAPGRGASGSFTLDPRGDHRMAFAFALLGLLRDGVDVLGPACVAKSWPSFWSDMARAGAVVLES